MKLLFDGQRQRKGRTATCDNCERMICKNEYYWTKVFLVINENNWREIYTIRSCCREL